MILFNREKGKMIIEQNVKIKLLRNRRQRLLATEGPMSGVEKLLSTDEPHRKRI